ncbi:hypothetical protein AX16_002374 [Volvariella volvacea WC 439]|nr:hypothetical protein AX16_002374 [Volvariella volvacea WC 439]
MPFARKFALLAALLGVVVYRSGRIARNTIFVQSPLPDGYFAGGDFSTHCETLKEDIDPSTPKALKYCEDITFWDLHDSEDNGGGLVERRVLLSCDANRKQWNTVMGPLSNPEPRGSLFWYAPGKDHGDGRATKPQKITLQGYPPNHDFHPLGAEVYPSYGGNSSYLYVINHARQRTFIEQFIVSPQHPDVAQYLRTISSPWFVAPNSLALTSPDSFYLTNDHLFTRRLPIVGHFLPLLESVFALPLPWVSHVTLNPLPASSSPSALESNDAIQSHEFSATFIPFANGIAISHDGAKVAIVSTTLNRVLIYTRDPQTNKLVSLDAAVEAPFSTDNVVFDDNDNIIIAGHPHFPTLTELAANNTPVAPSWVLEISPRKQRVEKDFEDEDRNAPVSVHTKVPYSPEYEVKTLLQSNGVGFSSSTTGLRDTKSGILYVSGLYAEDGVIVCRP